MALNNANNKIKLSTLTEEELEYLFNYLLENEIPATSLELAQTLQNREKTDQSKSLASDYVTGRLYRPSFDYQTGNDVCFPLLDWKEGRVQSVREGINPELGSFKVIRVAFDDQSIGDFVSSLESHAINQNTVEYYAAMQETSSVGDLQTISKRVNESFIENEDLVQIAGAWFPRSLLIEISPGYLNLAEAVLEMAEGGPLTTRAILDQVEYAKTGNSKLLEFSMNLALQEDDRFDEVGPYGETLWYLKRLEPEFVQSVPPLLKFETPEGLTEPPADMLSDLDELLYDELEPKNGSIDAPSVIEVNLIYPHLQSGTLPLSPEMGSLFPSAYEAPRVNFTFIDEDSSKEYTGWVVRPHRYVYGLSGWYKEKDLIPGSTIFLHRGEKPGHVVVKAAKIKPTKDWLKTVLVGTDGGAVITMLKQPISSKVDERMAFIVPTPAAVNKLWEKNRSHKAFIEKTIDEVLKQLMKLSPQGNVHALELYSGVNIFQRVPPKVILSIISNDPKIKYLGNLHFKRNDESQEY